MLMRAHRFISRISFLMNRMKVYFLKFNIILKVISQELENAILVV